MKHMNIIDVVTAIILNHQAMADAADVGDQDNSPLVKFRNKNLKITGQAGRYKI